MSTFQYSQVVQDTDSYKQLTWKNYLTNKNFKYIVAEIIEIPIHTYILNIQPCDQYFDKCRGNPKAPIGGVGWKMPSRPTIKT